jgi:hypothetical protein
LRASSFAPGLGDIRREGRNEQDNIDHRIAGKNRAAKTGMKNQPENIN